MTNLNILPLRLIRIAKDLTTVEMAERFGVTKAYISAIEKGIRTMHHRRLELGLINLDIPYSQYRELVSFCEMLDQVPLNSKDRFKFALIKTIGIINPELTEQSEQILEQHVPQGIVKKVPVTINQYQKVQS